MTAGFIECYRSVFPFPLFVSLSSRFLINRSSWADRNDLCTSGIRPIHDPMLTNPETPISFEFSLKWLSAVRILEDIVERRTYFALHVRMEMADKITNGVRNLERS